jgi:hypothetical protein
LAFLDIPHDGANGLASRQQGAGHRAADLAGYSRDCVHLRLLVLV